MDKVLGLRERKKLKTHNDIIENAWALFEEKGFENVKVTEIADKANISVKTLFTYFKSKEDIVFAGEDELINKIIFTFENRKSGESLIETEKKLIIDLINADNEKENLEGNSLIKIISNTPSITSRLLIMWKNHEKRLSDVLKADKELELSDWKAYIIAINLIAPFRLLFDFRIEKEQGGKISIEKIENELNDVFSIMENGIRGV